MEIFHENLKNTLRLREMSQRKLALKIGVAPQTVWEWLNEGAPSLERFRQICEILDVSADTLLGLNPTGGGMIFHPLRRGCESRGLAVPVSQHHYIKRKGADTVSKKGTSSVIGAPVALTACRLDIALGGAADRRRYSLAPKTTSRGIQLREKALGKGLQDPLNEKNARKRAREGMYRGMRRAHVYVRI